AARRRRLRPPLPPSFARAAVYPRGGGLAAPTRIAAFRSNDCPMFKSACFFRVADDFQLPPLDAFERVLHKARFVPCGPTQPESTGWVAPRSNKSKVLAELVGGQLVMKLCTEKRAVPSSAIKAAVEERVERYKAETGNE